MTNNNEAMWEGEEIGEISGWYTGKTVFITGGTGFMGKVLVEKLLYSCPGLSRIYILMRPKRGKLPEQRLEEMFKLPVFHRIRKEKPDAFKKIMPLLGDVVLERLGLSKSALERLYEETDIVFHVAATLKLEAKLKDAVEHNTGGTLRVIELCKEMRKLKSLIHVSTAFCNSDIEEMKERVYPVDCNPRDVIDCARWMKEEVLDEATPKLIAPHPNTYLYTKRLAETLVYEEYPNLPIAIIRPSIVSPAAKEPLPGWVDTLNGPVGILVGAGKGVIRTMMCHPKYHAQGSPVDIAINAFIVVAWKIGTAVDKPREIPVYNLTQDRVKPVTWQEILDIGRKIIVKYPFALMLWYPGGDMHTSKVINYINMVLFHWIPAYFIDFMMIIFRQKRFMVRIQTRITQGLELLQFFTMREWKFDCVNAMGLWQHMTGEDRKRFPIDQDSYNIEVEEYLTTAVLGAREYCIKEPLENLPQARRTLKMLYVLDLFVKILFYGSLIYMVYKWSPMAHKFIDDSLNSFTKYMHEMPLIRSFLYTRMEN